MSASTASSPAVHARETPDHPAIVMGGSGAVTTYAELDDRSSRLARVLRARGLEVGDHLAILMENNAAYLEVAWAAQRAGLHYTAVNSHLLPGEVQYVLDDCGATALVASEATAGAVADLDLSNVPVRIAGAGAVAGFEPYAEVLAGAPEGPLVDECEGREMLYSSGTTGRPKGVRKPRSGDFLGDPSALPVVIAQNMAARWSAPGAVHLTTAPLYHAAPLVTSMAMHRLGATVVVMERFDAETCLALIERHRVTEGQFVPTMFVRLLRLPAEVRARYDLSSLRAITHAAAPCPVAVKREMLAWWGPIIHEYYSGTEDIGSTFIGPEEWLAHPGSVGRPVEQCHIVGPDGEEVPAGQTGLVYFAGGRPFEYHNDPGKTASIANERGWRTLGDIGHLDADGYLYLTDRQVHMIISGGVNIYPQEAENVLAGHPAVADVAVIGVPDDDKGEAVKAVVELVDPGAASDALAAELVAFCRRELAPYKCPRTVDFVAELPRDENGKLYKRRLRDAYWEGHDSRI